MGGLSMEAIKEAIASLPEKDRLSLTGWLNLQSMDDWDRQMQRDFSPGGKGMRLLRQVRREIAAGKTEAMTEGLAKRRIRRS